MQSSNPEQPTISGKYYFSSEALISAYVNTNLSQDIINEHLDLTQTETDIKYCSFNLNAVINSVIFIEAAINDFYSEISEAKDDSHEIFRLLGKESIERVQEFLSINTGFLQTENNLYKYNLALVLLNKKPLDKGGTLYQSAQTLVDFRNYLIHYPSFVTFREGNL